MNRREKELVKEGKSPNIADGQKREKRKENTIYRTMGKYSVTSERRIPNEKQKRKIFL